MFCPQALKHNSLINGQQLSSTLSFRIYPFQINQQVEEVSVLFLLLHSKCPKRKKKASVFLVVPTVSSKLQRAKAEREHPNGRSSAVGGGSGLLSSFLSGVHLSHEVVWIVSILHTRTSPEVLNRLADWMKKSYNTIVFLSVLMIQINARPKNVWSCLILSWNLWYVAESRCLWRSPHLIGLHIFSLHQWRIVPVDKNHTNRNIL